MYNVNYHFVWCPKSSKSKICVPRGISDPAQYRHAILEPIEDSLEASFRDVCDQYNYDILSLHISPDHVHLFLSAYPEYSPSEIVRTVKNITAGRCGNSTNHSWRSTCGAVGFGRNRTTWGRQAMFRPTRLSSISSERNLFSGAYGYGLHTRGQAPSHSACYACR
ncbi:transposase IS200-family protein [Haloferax mucosum ATCC BAA-1512]|uniref:Transposase IS200-family protein n=1 Tax=Haloferax mucosum ATCC BAA-1512 TaxID=662479 RepID=M0IIV0_9EURY|nr:transposase IS200-family protein [Haloferax mucosum ATCC BAA-1512]